MKKKKNKKVKLKHKKIVIPILICILLLICGGVVAGFVLYQDNAEDLIKKNYNKYVVTTGKVKLFDKNKKVIGTINKGYNLELEEVKNISKKNKYFKIKDTDNYISYKNIKKTKEFKHDNNISNYVVYNKNIKGSNVSLKIDKKVYIQLKNINLPILYMDKDNYYVSFLNDVFSIKKKSVKEVKSNNTKDKVAEYVSVLNYEVIDKNCEEANCFDKSTIKSQTDLLKENGYYFIDKDDYIMFINNYVRLKEKAVLITTSKETEEVKSINNEFGLKISVINDKDKIKFEDTNKKSTQKDDHNKLNRYSIKYYTTNENIIKMANGEDVVESEPPKNPNMGIAVLNYHFFYDPATQSCNESICLKVDIFRSHLQYLKDNGYKTLTMKEFTNWMYGKIELPEKSVLITVDDGAMGTGKHNGNHLATILDEYKMHATLFLITGWWDLSNYQGSEYLEVQSHTNDMHQYGGCGSGQLVCANYDGVKEDLQKSLDIIGDNTSFCYPFYQYDDEAIQAIKDLGFKVAFAGGNRKATRNSDKYKIPRYPILSDHTASDIARMVG